MKFAKDAMPRLIYFIDEREKVRRLKEARATPPWTKDPILQKYRFCNVHREDDKVTRWIAANWRHSYREEKHMWFAMVVARLFNLPITLMTIGFPVPFREKSMRAALRALQQSGCKVFNGAYFITTHGVAMGKVDYLLERVLAPLWTSREKLYPHKGDSLSTFASRLSRFNGLGTFMTGQVVADLKYAAPLRYAPDWYTWAYSGPGSRRGLNRMLGRPTDTAWREKDWHAALLLLRESLPYPELHAQDLQNCLCEFDKYERARLGEGTPKQLYKGA